MQIKPERWDPRRPLAHFCIYCYERTAHVFLWKYGINYSCFEGNCLHSAKRSVGFVGFFANIAAAEQRKRVIAAEAAEKEAKRGAQRGSKGRRVDSRGSGVRTSDYRR